MNMTDNMDFACDEHNGYGKISNVLLCIHAYIFVLEVKVHYTINVHVAFTLRSKQPFTDECIYMLILTNTYHCSSHQF